MKEVNLPPEIIEEFNTLFAHIGELDKSKILEFIAKNMNEQITKAMTDNAIW